MGTFKRLRKMAATDPLQLNVNAFCTPDELDEFCYRFQDDAFANEIYGLTNVKPNFSKSNYIIQCTQEFNEWFKRRKLKGVKDDPNQKLEFPRDSIIPEVVKHAVFHQISHKLLLKNVLEDEMQRYPEISFKATRLLEQAGLFTDSKELIVAVI